MGFVTDTNILGARTGLHSIQPRNPHMGAAAYELLADDKPFAPFSGSRP
jgi:hypothetical protein